MPPSTKLFRASRFAQLQYLRALRTTFTPVEAQPVQRWTRQRRRSNFELVPTVSRSPRTVSQYGRRLYSVRRLRTVLHPGHVVSAQSKLNANVAVLRATSLRRKTGLLQKRALLLGKLRRRTRSRCIVTRRGFLYTTLERCGVPSRSHTVVRKHPKVLPQSAIKLNTHLKRKRRRCVRRIRRGVNNFSLPVIRRRRVKFLDKKAYTGFAASASVGLLCRQGAKTTRALLNTAGVKFFKSKAGLQTVRKANFAVACAKRVRHRRQTLFDSYRPRL